MDTKEIVAKMIILLMKVRMVLSKESTPTDALNFVIKTVEERIEILKQEQPN